MVSAEVLETMCEAMMNELQRRGIRNADWHHATASHRIAYREAMRAALKAAGVKVEGEEPQF